MKQHEIGAFIEMGMMMATGEGDVTLEYVRCLHTAILGYSPLIYGINEDKDTSFQEFLDICSEVWQTLVNNPNLPRNFVSRKSFLTNSF